MRTMKDMNMREGQYNKEKAQTSAVKLLTSINIKLTELGDYWSIPISCMNEMIEVMNVIDSNCQAVNKLINSVDAKLYMKKMNSVKQYCRNTLFMTYYCGKSKRVTVLPRKMGKGQRKTKTEMGYRKEKCDCCSRQSALIDICVPKEVSKTNTTKYQERRKAQKLQRRQSVNYCIIIRKIVK